MSLSKEAIAYIEGHQEETLQLLLQLAQIPAPSYHEEKRVAFCADWLKRNGVENVCIDEAQNVICSFGDCSAGTPLTVFLSHSDVVFPDTDPLPLHVENGRIYCPGVGDNTIHVVHTLLAARYLTEKGLRPKEGGVLLVIDSCEEGLGNLRGARKIIDTFGDRITAFYSLDSKDGKVCVQPVGSKRYRVKVSTEGGHSFNNFGNRNAIVYLASLIETLYQLEVPPKGHNTYNVGTILGGTSVNTIAQQAEMLYEMRSDCRESLAEMDRHFHAALAFYRTKGIDVHDELVGERPCKGDIDEGKQKQLEEHAASVVRTYFPNLDVRFTAGSTDCNIPSSKGIPAVNTGCYIGYGTHTREENIEIGSICPSQKVAFDLILECFCDAN